MAQPASFNFQHTGVSQFNDLTYIQRSKGSRFHGLKSFSLFKLSTLFFWYFYKNWSNDIKRRAYRSYFESKSRYKYIIKFMRKKITSKSKLLSYDIRSVGNAFAAGLGKDRVYKKYKLARASTWRKIRVVKKPKEFFFKTFLTFVKVRSISVSGFFLFFFFLQKAKKFVFKRNRFLLAAKKSSRYLNVNLREVYDSTHVV